VVWLAAQEAAGRHELVDKVLTTFLSTNLPAGAVVVAQVTAHLLRLVDGPGAARHTARHERHQHPVETTRSTP